MSKNESLLDALKVIDEGVSGLHETISNLEAENTRLSGEVRSLTDKVTKGDEYLKLLDQIRAALPADFAVVPTICAVEVLAAKYRRLAEASARPIPVTDVEVVVPQSFIDLVVELRKYIDMGCTFRHPGDDARWPSPLTLKIREAEEFLKSSSRGEFVLTHVEAWTRNSAPAVHLTDIEAVVKEFAGSKLLRHTITAHTRPLSREALVQLIGETLSASSGDPKDQRSIPRVCADAVLSFLGAGAVDSQASIVVGESRSGDASKMPQHEGASPDSSAAKASLAEAARAKMNEPKRRLEDSAPLVDFNGWPERPTPMEHLSASMDKPTPAPQESDVERLVKGFDDAVFRPNPVSEFHSKLASEFRGIDDAQAQTYDRLSLHRCLMEARVKHAMSVSPTKPLNDIDALTDAALSWFRAHRVVELPRYVGPAGRGPGYRFLEAYQYALEDVKKALSRAGIQFTEAK